MFCKSCGKELSEQATFCPNCGQLTKETSHATQSKSDDNKKGKWSIGTFVLFLLLGILIPIVGLTVTLLASIMGELKPKLKAQATFVFVVSMVGFIFWIFVGIG